MNTAEFIVSILEKKDVSYVFGIPGGAIEDFNTALFNSGKIKPIVTKHEEGAAFMADGYARVSGKLGVCFSTAGPGATNLITGIATAHGDSIPVCALTGQVATSVFGKGAIQESGPEAIDIVNIFANFTKYSDMLGTKQRALYMVEKAFRVALSYPSGPVHLSLPADVMKQTLRESKFHTYEINKRIFDREGVKSISQKLITAKKPVIIAGWGVVLSRGAPELLELAELLDIPVATSPKAKGVFPESHPLSLGVTGFAGSPVAKEYIIESEVDLLLAIGTSFNETMTSGWDERLCPSKHLIHIDVDCEKIGKNYMASIGLIGDAKTVLKELSFAVKRECGAPNVNESCLGRNNFRKKIKKLKQKHADKIAKPINNNRLYNPLCLIKDVQKNFPSNTIYFADMGNNMAWAIRHMVIDKPYSFFVCMGFSSMGYAVAAPVGAKLASPDQPVVALVGDGSFLMNGFEVATAVNYNIPVIWVVFNNAMLGMVYHGRKLFKEPIPEGIPSRFNRVDFVKVAEGLGAQGIRIDKPGSITPKLVKEILASGKPTVLDVWIDEEEVPPIHSRIETVDKHFS